MSLGAELFSYALNCAAVPYRNALGHPILPAGTPVGFEMQMQTPPTGISVLKVTWTLAVPDLAGAGGSVEVY